MAKNFSINFKANNFPTFEQEDEMIAGEAISVFNQAFDFLKLKNSCLSSCRMGR